MKLNTLNLRSAALAAAVLAAFGVTQAHAGLLTGSGPYNLNTVITDNDSIQVGDLVYFDFGYTSSGDMPSATGVSVSAVPSLVVDGTIPTSGIVFTGGFTDLQGGGASDATIFYQVMEAAGSGNLISDAHLEGNPAVVSGTGEVIVTESWLPDIGDKQITIDAINALDPTVGAGVVFGTPVASISVQKDILADAGTGGVSLSVIDQTYSETPIGRGGNPIPEPASLSLLAVAGLGLLARKARRA